MTSVQEIYKKYVEFGSTASAPKKELTGANFMKLMKDAKMIDKKLNRTEIDMIFTKAKGGPGIKTLSFTKFQNAIKLAAKSKYGSDSDEKVEQFKKALNAVSGPSISGATKTSKDSATSRLTDSTGYTGSHKERFDETGKGKGIEGRKYLNDKSGYVSGYKEQGTYDKKH